MGNAVLIMSMSLDGYIGGRDGDDGLHNWVFGGSVPVDAAGMTFHLASETSAKVFKEMVQATGAYIVGKHTFTGANENPIFQKSTFVVTHTARPPLDKQGVIITFVTEGIESALKQAQAAAGDKDVCIFGGASVAQQYLHANLVDEIDINLIPKLIGGGLRLFDEEWGQPVQMEIQNVVAGAQVTHMKYRVMK